MQVAFLLIVRFCELGKLQLELFLFIANLANLIQLLLLTFACLLFQMHDVRFETFKLSDHRHRFLKFDSCLMS